MLHRIKNILFVLLIIPMALIGQGNENSVYSRFGLGDPVDNNFMHLRSMGGISAAFNDLYHVNIVNPASLGHLRAVSFDIGVGIKMSQLTESGTSQNIESGALDYVSFALPLSNKVNEILEREERDYNFTTAFSLLPHTRVGYNITSLEESENFGNYLRNFKGSGGTYKFVWSNAVRYKDFSFGANLGYLFGKIKYERNNFFDPEEYAFDNTFSSSYSLSGFLWKAGVQFSPILNRKAFEENQNIRPKVLSIGAYFGSNTNFSTKSDFLNISSREISGFPTTIDTLSSSLGVEGSGVLPGVFGAGIIYQGGEKFTIGIDYSRTNWSSYENEVNPQVLDNSSKLSFGGYFRPNYLSQKSYWDRVYYRFGGYHFSDPRKISDKQVKTTALTFGLGLPFVYQRRISHANLGIELGQRGSGTLIEEKFIRFNIGFTFNDTEWFLKRKYD